MTGGKSASGLFALMRNLGGAIGIAVSATVAEPICISCALPNI
jgi:hypothetical protein